MNLFSILFYFELKKFPFMIVLNERTNDDFSERSRHFKNVFEPMSSDIKRRRKNDRKSRH